MKEMEGLEVKETGDGRGKGLYATKHFRKSEKIGEYLGHRINKKELVRRYGGTLATYVLEVGEDSYLDDRDGESPVAFSNDAVCVEKMKELVASGIKSRRAYTAATDKSKRNSYVRSHGGRAFLYASKKIEPGQEITWSYGSSYWE